MEGWKASEEKSTFYRDQSELESSTFDISDDALEALSCAEVTSESALSLNFSSFHLHCC
jgi:hypothetical protein